jgi:signal transduction histidine kinase
MQAKLLIVDDVGQNLTALEALVREDDRLVCLAESGETALSLMLEHDFALAIIDVQMPGMSGLELAQLMRGTEKTRHIPIIFVSAGPRELNYAFAGYENGAVDFLYKPLDPHAVRSKVNVFVGIYLQRLRQEILLRELQETQAQLQDAIRMRDDFMSLVSHELRTPLNTLYLQAQLRRRMATGGTFSAQQLETMMERDEQQIRNMVRMIEEMLDVSRLRQGTLTISERDADLAVLVRRVIESHAGQAAAAGCIVDLSGPPSLPGFWDEFRIEQVAANLLTNAFRYGAGKPVQVRVESAPGEALLTVRDHGIGIAAEDQSRIFGQFERAVDKKFAPGLGLGLFIARNIVEAHGGRIEVRSETGQGAAFTVRLPLDRPAAAAA